MSAEEGHLALLERLLSARERSALLPIWRVSGFALGLLPALLGGTHALYRTVEAVETFVEEHYGDQIRTLNAAGGACPQLVSMVTHCCEEEVHHREDAAARAGGAAARTAAERAWAAVVDGGSRVAVAAARAL